MSGIFDESTIKQLKLKNRIVRSATWEGMCAPDGRPTGKLINCYKDLAAGGTGLIITGYTFVRPDGKQLPGKMGIHTDDFEAEMREMTEAVHSEGGRICIQLVHAGGQASSQSASRTPLAPSAVKVDQFPETPEELSPAEIEDIASAFGRAAGRAKSWGFDTVQLHGAHGYLINQFLSPLTNRRTDEYGGGIENRCRFMMKVYERVRNEVGDSFPVMIKLNAADNLEGGLTEDDALIAAKTLSEAGIDAIEISAGTPASGDKSPVRTKIDSPEKEAYNLDLAKRIKEAVKCPVMAVGGFRSFDMVNQSIRDGGMDYISMSRPLIREPGLVNRWKAGDRSTAKCISCNSCFRPGLKEGGIYCVVEAKEKKRQEGK